MGVFDPNTTPFGYGDACGLLWGISAGEIDVCSE